MKKGTIHVIENFYMPELDRYRTIRIYLPPHYNESGRHYPVIYMHDAQNLFTVATSSFGTIWDTAVTLDKLYNENPEKAYIVVGIDNGCNYRYSEYCPWYSEVGGEYLPHAKASGMLGGEGFKYIDFIVNTLKPFIDTTYKTLKDRENTAICGSSMGGLISMCAGIKYQDVFSKIAAFSSAMYFAEEEVKNFIISEGKRETMRIYMDVGTDETSNPNNPYFPQVYLSCNSNVYLTLKDVGFNSKDVKYEIAEGDIHNEACWCKRFPDMMNWLFTI
ncbi:hypothetical protein CSC2_41530 [Clostridium zeae]|uniref:Carbohydrate esterase n=1 Tax=Clostridium zeae TaxID=2759022 RepID=A0ABQ1EFS0_9CLOT|nr:alpha/beta hydrolase-fold protein [Clostridium zeae]GFZ33627.1 hypothetical protein CSC2_41530 [Clostridium zeae]